MLRRRQASAMRARLLGWRKQVAGTAAIEFALILPLMLTIYFGSYVLTQGIRASRKVDLLASALANLTSQQLSCSTTGSTTTPCLTDTDMTGPNGVFTAASAIMQIPSAQMASTVLQMTVSQIKITSSNNQLSAKVDWTVTNNGGSPRPCNGGGPNGALLAGNVAPNSAGYQNYLPTSYTANGAPQGSMIVADVVYQYKPLVNWEMFKWNSQTVKLNMANVGYYRNRNNNASPIQANMSNVTKCT